MLHDTIEDTTVTREEVDKAFGEEIGGLVDGLTKLGKLDFVTKHAEQAEEISASFCSRSPMTPASSWSSSPTACATCARCNSSPRSETKRVRIAEDTLDIYAPLAGRMGMQSMRNELEDLAFRCLMRTPINSSWRVSRR